MEDSILGKSALFRGVPEAEIRKALEQTPHHVLSYEKDEIIFHMMDEATRLGVVLEGRTEAQKTFPNGSQINVSVRGPGALIGPAAVFSSSRRYPCDVVALEAVTVLMFRREAMLGLMQRHPAILENMLSEIASATYMLQQRLELMSYSGIAQKAAFWLLMQARQTGRDTVRIPDSMSKWALLMNVSRTSLHRELKKLEAKGMISCSPPTVRILDADRLQAVLSN